MNTFWRCLACLLALLVLPLAIGCGTTKYQPVTGRVVFPDGSPVTALEGRQVIFESSTPASEGMNTLQATGTIDASGRFKLGTEQLGDGAPAGTYRAMISDAVSSGDIPPPPVIDRKYSKFDTSGLQYEVKPGKNDFQITVDPSK